MSPAPEYSEKRFLSLSPSVFGVVIGVIVFFVLIFALSLPSKVRRGDAAHEAIQMLDAMRRPFLKIKDAETRLLKSGDVKVSSLLLEKGIERADSMIERYLVLASYNPEVLKPVEELKTVYRDWVFAERHLFDHVSEVKASKSVETLPNGHFLENLNNASIGFLKTMDSLGDSEGPIHEDIDLGRSAVHTLLGLSALFFLYVIGILFYYQSRRIQALKRMHNELEEHTRVREQAEEELTSLGRIVDHSVNEVYIFDAQTLKFIMVNDGARKNLGFSMEEMRNLTPVDIKPEHTEEEFSALIEPLRDGDTEDVRFTTVHRRKDGARYPVEVYLQLSTFGSVPDFFAIILDITEKKRIEEELKLEKEYFEKLYNSLGEAVFTVNIPDRLIESANPSVETIFGYSPRECIGKPTEMFYPKGEADEFGKKLKSAMDKGSDLLRTEHRLIRKNKDEFPAGITTTFFREAGEITRVISIVRDITAQKLADEQIKASLKEKEVLLKEIHHRVKNNLQVVSSILNLQSGYIEDKKLQEVFRESQNRIKSMALVHEQLYQTSDLSNISFSEYVNALITNIFRSYAYSPSLVEFKADIEDIKIDIDTSIVLGLLLNELCTNALKYSFVDGRKGEFKVSFSQEDNNYILVVSDNGVGLPDGLDLEKAKSMGFLLVRSMITQLDGTLEVDSSSGTSFKITFPA